MPDKPGQCTRPDTHSFPDLHPDTQCTWCEQTVDEVLEEDATTATIESDQEGFQPWRGEVDEPDEPTKEDVAHAVATLAKMAKTHNVTIGAATEDDDGDHVLVIACHPSRLERGIQTALHELAIKTSGVTP